MIAFNFDTPAEIVVKIAAKARAKRLALNLSQQSVATRAGVSYGTLKKFEQTGQISLLSLLKIAIVLEAVIEFTQLFPEFKLEKIRSLDELIKKTQNVRKRGRQ